VAFQVIPPPEEEPAPEPPALPGATGLEGRYGVVAGERRTVVWVFTFDPAVYPSAEALEPALAALASSRAGGAPAEGVEVVDRVVQRATGTGGAPSARGFRHHRLAVLVEGMDPAQVDAVVSAWITVLASA
jgi:FAD/FMN-containing dehydrogenase